MTMQANMKMSENEINCINHQARHFAIQLNDRRKTPK